MTTIQIISAIIIALATIFNVYLAFWKYKEQKPVMDIKLENLPPYKGENDKTIIIVKNVGNKNSQSDLDILISCSWMANISYKLNLPNKDFRFQPNEEMKWKLKLSDILPENSIISVCVSNHDNSMYWDYFEQVT